MKESTNVDSESVYVCVVLSFDFELSQSLNIFTLNWRPIFF